MGIVLYCNSTVPEQRSKPPNIAKSQLSPYMLMTGTPQGLNSSLTFPRLLIPMIGLASVKPLVLIVSIHLIILPIDYGYNHRIMIPGNLTLHVPVYTCANNHVHVHSWCVRISTDWPASVWFKFTHLCRLNWWIHSFNIRALIKRQSFGHQHDTKSISQPLNTELNFTPQTVHLLFSRF